MYGVRGSKLKIIMLNKKGVEKKFPISVLDGKKLEFSNIKILMSLHYVIRHFPWFI